MHESGCFVSIITKIVPNRRKKQDSESADCTINILSISTDLLVICEKMDSEDSDALVH